MGKAEPGARDEGLAWPRRAIPRLPGRRKSLRAGLGGGAKLCHRFGVGAWKALHVSPFFLQVARWLLNRLPGGSPVFA